MVTLRPVFGVNGTCKVAKQEILPTQDLKKKQDTATFNILQLEADLTLRHPCSGSMFRSVSCPDLVPHVSWTWGKKGKKGNDPISNGICADRRSRQDINHLDRSRARITTIIALNLLRTKNMLAFTSSGDPTNHNSWR